MSLGTCKCGAQLKSLFTGTYCAAECDIPASKNSAKWLTFPGELSRHEFNGSTFILFGSPPPKSIENWKYEWIIKHPTPEVLQNHMNYINTTNGTVLKQSTLVWDANEYKTESILVRIPK